MCSVRTVSRWSSDDIDISVAAVESSKGAEGEIAAQMFPARLEYLQFN